MNDMVSLSQMSNVALQQILHLHILCFKFNLNQSIMFLHFFSFVLCLLFFVVLFSLLFFLFISSYYWLCLAPPVLQCQKMLTNLSDATPRDAVQCATAMLLNRPTQQTADFGQFFTDFSILSPVPCLASYMVHPTRRGIRFPVEPAGPVWF